MPFAGIGAILISGWAVFRDALARIGDFYLTNLTSLAIWIGAN